MKELQEFVREKCIMSAPLTLSRVLNACIVKIYQDIAKQKEIYSIQLDYKEKKRYISDMIINDMDWQLLNDDGTDCNFEQQSKETQLAIAKLLGYKETI